jgi:chemosensory pili system protein ChpA (sensor histidine kinase/response regulator)
MTGQADDRQFLLSVFLMEAWDTLATLEEALRTLATETSPTWSADAQGAFEDLRVVTHRLRGAAGLHGFPRVSAVAAMMEQIVERLTAMPAAQRGDAFSSLADLITSLRATFDTIGATGQEDGADLAAAMTRHATAIAPPADAPTSDGHPAGAPDAMADPSVVVDGDAGVRELERFFVENPDVVTYFVPEAHEHLELAGTSLLALEGEGRNDENVATLFRAVHTLKGAAYTVGCSVIGRLAHRIEDLLGAVRAHTLSLTPSLIEVMFIGIDALKLLVQRADGPVPGLAATLANARARLEAVAPPSTEATPAEESVAESASLTAAEIVPTLWTPATAPRGRAVTGRFAETAPARPSIRVSLDRLDGVMNLVGELVIARSRLERRLLQIERTGDLLHFTRARMTQAAREFDQKYGHPSLPLPDARDRGSAPTPTPSSAPLDAVFDELEFDRYDDLNIVARRVSEIAEDVSEIQAQLAEFVRAVRQDTGRVQSLTGELRSEITRARMVPVSRLFARFTRQVRETARTAGKTVTLEVAGESAEMDNTLVEQIVGPLLHLVQNAIIHGLEPEADRLAAGKTAHGTVYLNAYHKGSSIYVEVADNGRGIDARAIRARAVGLGLIRPEAAALLPDAEALELIFLPGFSTVATITEAAGRGVGMDVVRTDVARLNGEIDVETAVGIGTRFTIKLPLTVTISDAFLVRVRTEVLAVPVTAVRRVLMLRPEEIRDAGGAETVLVDEERIDLVTLHEVLGVPRSPRVPRLPVLVLRVGRRSMAVAVDELLGKEEVVVKSLGEFLEGVGPFAGASIDGEGRVILLLDPARLLTAGADAIRAAGLPVTDTTAPALSRGGRSVLLVDDSVSVRRFVRQMLERAGFSVTTANDGADALRQLDGLVVDVIVTDLEMPNVNGFELIRDLRRRPATREVPVVVLTTRVGNKHMGVARQLGVSHYMAKPVDEQAFVQLIESLAATAAGAAGA